MLSGEVDYEEFRLGILKLGYSPPIEVSFGDWIEFTLQGTLSSESDALSREGFDMAIRWQLSQVPSRCKLFFFEFPAGLLKLTTDSPCFEHSQYTQRLIATKMEIALQVDIRCCSSIEVKEA